MRKICALCLSALLVSPALVAQEAVPGLFGDVIDVRVVNLEVVVEDGDGNRVAGLDRSDFRLQVDGEDVPIEFFNEVRGGIAVEATDDDGSLPGLAPGEPVGTSYLVFVDSYFTLPRDRNLVVRELAEDLALLGPQDRVAVVNWDGRSPEMISSWSQQPADIRAAFEELKDLPSSGLQRIAERRRFDFESLLEESEEFRLGADAVQNFEGGGATFGSRAFFSDLTPEERFYANLVTSQVERSVRAAGATLRSFASPPGRKVMILVMGGWPFFPAQFVVAGSGRTAYLWGREAGPGDLFRDLSDTANRLGYTIYPVDAEGMAQSAPDASIGSAQRATLSQTSSFLREREVHASLEFLADETGGEAYFNSQRRVAMERVVSDTRSYYWLGFTPQWKGDDSVHDVQVTVDRPGLKVRMRKDYLDLSRRAETTMAVEGSVLFGAPLPGKRLDLKFGRPERAGMGRVQVPVELEIPLGDVAFLPTGEGVNTAANLELRIAVIDSRGDRADIPVIPIQLKGRGVPTEDSVYPYKTDLKMRKQRHEVVVAVYDPTSGTMISGSAEISP